MKQSIAMDANDPEVLGSYERGDDFDSTDSSSSSSSSSSLFRSLLHNVQYSRDKYTVLDVVYEHAPTFITWIPRVKLWDMVYDLS